MVEVTEAGRALGSAVAAAWEQLDALTCANLTDEEADVLRDLLTRVRDGLRAASPRC